MWKIEDLLTPKEILEQLIAQAEKSEDAPFKVERSDGTILFFNFIGRTKDGEQGGTVLLLFPGGLAESMWIEAEAAIDELLANTELIVKDQNIAFKLSDSKEAHDPLIRKSLISVLTKIELEVYLDGLWSKLRYTLPEWEQEALLISKQIMLKYMVDGYRHGGYKILRTRDLKEQMNIMLERMAADRKDFLSENINLYSTRPQLSRLDEFYQMLLPIWQDARKIYRSNKESDKWADMVRAKYPETRFDDDLLMRLSGRLNDLPEDIQAKVSEKGGDSTAASIAIEHAARMCGAPHYQYTTRYLYGVKKSAKTKTEQSDAE